MSPWGDDNEGKPSHDPPWVEVSEFALSGKKAKEAKSAIVKNVSKVILECPSTAGDNFIVMAEVESAKPIEIAVEFRCSQFLHSEFQHQGKPGWFCLVAAMGPFPVPNATTPIFIGKVKLEKDEHLHSEYFDIPGEHLDVGNVEIAFGGSTLTFALVGAMMPSVYGPPTTRCYLENHDIQPEFTAGDGSISHSYAVRYFYSPRFQTARGETTRGG
ncbi:MAG TPA: hypothetical protein VNO21_02070, partial [Polyangiaceae bacterium]|nr:hypothetical protein [Polyangiaceae bacterium]